MNEIRLLNTKIIENDIDLVKNNSSDKYDSIPQKDTPLIYETSLNKDIQSQEKTIDILSEKTKSFKIEIDEKTKIISGYENYINKVDEQLKKSLNSKNKLKDEYKILNEN